MSCQDPNRQRTIRPKIYTPKWCNPVCTKPLPEKPVEKILIKTCRQDPPHPCDPVDCDPDVSPDGGNCKPKICLHRIKNYPDPKLLRCKSGYKFPIENCREEPHHPCDPPLPCVPGKPKQMICKTFLCRQRIKNPEPKIIRCPGPDDLIEKHLCANRDLFQAVAKVCPRGPCDPIPPIKPNPPPPCCGKSGGNKSKKREFNPFYSKPICDNWDLFFKTPIKECPPGPCEKPTPIKPRPPPPCCAQVNREAEEKKQAEKK